MECKIHILIWPDNPEAWVCSEGRCTWWDEELQCCAILSIAKHLRKLGK